MSAASERNFDAFLVSPTETLETEFKAWFDPQTPEGVAKIAKGCIALYNNNGGIFAIGINQDGSTDVTGAPSDVEGTFTPDLIQGIVSKYAAKPFPIEVTYRRRDNVQLVLVSVPAGVTFPCACKSELSHGGKVLLRNHAIFVRTVNSNNSVSSSEAKCNDWDDLVRRCFDNREADIGSFFRRQMASADVHALASIFSEAGQLARTPTASEQAVASLDRGFDRFRLLFADRSPQLDEKTGFREFASVTTGTAVSVVTDQELLWKLSASSLRQSGWPPWLIITGPGENSAYVFDDGFEALLNMSGHFRSVDYWRIVPGTSLYHISALEDDVVGDRLPLQPFEMLDFVIQVRKATECLCTALAMTQAIGHSPAETTLHVAMRWRKLRGRRLATWSDPRRSYWSAGVAVQDVKLTRTQLPLDTPYAAIVPYVDELVSPLFLLFDAQRFDASVIEGIVRDTIQRRY